MKKIHFKILALLILLLISCSNYKAADPFFYEEDNSNVSICNIPEDADPKYFIKSDYKDSDIELIIQEYFEKYNCYIIFLADKKDNISKNNTIDNINKIIKKDKYLKGVSIDLSRTDMTELKDDALKDNKNLIHIKLPNTIRTIGKNAFSGCSGLKTVNFPSSILKIEEGAFRLCRYLYSVDLSETKIKIIHNQTFYECSSLTEIKLPETISIGIDASAFAYCISLSSINIPSELNIIGGYAFSECRSLKNIKLNENITNISQNSFYNCLSLEEINLPKGLKSIGEDAFSGCSSLKKIQYEGDKSDSITLTKPIFNALFKPEELYLPNVKSDDGSWNNFLNYDWKSNGRIIIGKYAASIRRKSI